MKLQIFFLCVLIAFPLVPLRGESEDARPNILFILTDDQRWDTLGCYGNKIIKTPNLDKFAEGATRLDNFYVVSPLCAPSRANFLTGLYAHQSGVVRNNDKLPKELKTIAHYLNEAGYITGFVGKAHMHTDPKQWGFQEVPLYMPSGKSNHEDPSPMVNGKYTKMKGTITEIFADSAIQFLENHKQQKWFLWLATTAPHEPYIEDSNNLYDLEKMMPPPGWPPKFDFDGKKAEWKRYYATITMLDTQMGRVLNKLDELGIRDQVLVIVTSDNGFMFGSHGKADKGTWFEEAVKVPAIFRWPGVIPSHNANKNLYSSADFFPTILQSAGITSPKDIYGMSMLESLKTGKPLHSAIISELEFVMVRKGNYKFVKPNLKTSAVKFYDLANDPYELEDISRQKSLGSTLEEFNAIVSDWLAKTPPRVSDKPPLEEDTDSEDDSE